MFSRLIEIWPCCSSFSFRFSGPTSLAFDGSEGGEPNAVNNGEDYVELRMCCDGYACMHGQVCAVHRWSLTSPLKNAPIE